jgi:tetratricopeptide (TPR) repeat protein
MNQGNALTGRIPMNFSRLWIGFVLMRIAADGAAVRAEEPSHNGNAVMVALEAGDSAFAQFNNTAALAAYRRALALDSTNYRVLWKTVLAYVLVGIPSKDPVQEQYYRLAEKLGRRCVALYPDSATSHFILAMALGRVALKEGGKKKIALAKEIKAEAEHTLTLAPCHDGAMHVLGRWNYELGHLSWLMRSFAKIAYGGVPPSGGNQAARSWFERASACAPRLLIHHFWLGKTLVDLKEYALAREHLQKCLELQIVHWDDHLHQANARKLLAEIKKKH